MTPSPVPSPALSHPAASQPCLLMHQENHTLEPLTSTLAPVSWLRAKSLAYPVLPGHQTPGRGMSFHAVTLPELSQSLKNTCIHYVGSRPKPHDFCVPSGTSCSMLRQMDMTVGRKNLESHRVPTVPKDASLNVSELCFQLEGTIAKLLK